MANEFNQFFSSVGEKTVDKVKTLAQECNYVLAQHLFTPRSFPSAQQFSFRSMEQCEIENIILSMPTGKALGGRQNPSMRDSRLSPHCFTVIGFYY